MYVKNTNIEFIHEAAETNIQTFTSQYNPTTVYQKEKKLNDNLVFGCKNV